MTIRPYEPRDRESVRRICYVTGYMGDPVDWLWRDEESFADLFTSYYTDAEPGSALVVELDGEVSGYLLGCLDTAKAWNPAKIYMHHVVRRQIAFRRGTAGMVWRSFADVAVDALKRRLPPPSISDPRWPSHLHIDLLTSARGMGGGAQLIRRWLGMLKDLGSSGCHLETLGENRKAIAFFEAMGFRRHGRLAFAPGLRSPTGQRHTVQLMVQPFTSVDAS